MDYETQPQTARAREDDEARILVTYTRRLDGTTVIHDLRQPVTSVLRHFDWASMMRGEGWLVPTERWPLVMTALRGTGVQLADTSAPFLGDDTAIPPPIGEPRYAPQRECARCAAPYRDGDTPATCWQCGTQLILIRPQIL